MSPNNKNYYEILGVSPDATSREIQKEYKRLMKDNHPDRFKGLRAKYEAEGDNDLLAVIDERIYQSEETCQLINEAYETLSDQAKRKAYDDQVYDHLAAPPEIEVIPMKLSFGKLTGGRRKSKSFTINNKGGLAEHIQIDWEKEPDWGERLTIEPDPEETFPIKVAVNVDTTGVSPGPKSQRILVTVDGTVHAVEISLTVSAPVSHKPASKGVVPKSQKRKAMAAVGVILLIAAAFLLPGLLSKERTARRENEAEWSITLDSIYTQAAGTLRAIASPTPTQEEGISLEEVIEVYEQQNAQASRLELEEELAVFELNPESLVTIKRQDKALLDRMVPAMGGIKNPICQPNKSGCGLLGTWEVTNNSQFSVMFVGGCHLVKDVYQSQTITSFDFYDSSFDSELYPGVTRVLVCTEYSYTPGWRWSGRGPITFHIDFENQLGYVEKSFTLSPPQENLNLSELVNISVQRLPTVKHAGLLEITIAVDEKYPYFLSIGVITTEPDSTHYSSYEDLLWPNLKDTRILEKIHESDFSSGETHTRYMYLDNFVPESICFELEAYTHSEVICVDVP